MLHPKFQGHRPYGSGEEYFEVSLPYMVMWHRPHKQIFIPPSH